MVISPWRRKWQPAPVFLPGSSLLPPHTIPLGRPSAPAPSIQYRASNLDWQLVSYMILHMFQYGLCWRGRGWEDLGERNTFQEVVWEKSWNPVPEYVAKGPFFFFGDTPLNFQRFRDNVWKRPRSNMTSVFWASIGILGTRFSFLLHGGIECNFLQERSCLW